ncbi:hypothetical protein [Haloarcula sp. K1]|uniref:hypothetical protein n=1 Tax=Haloarcula sp. K1 TaxID=1622207 RepID=UPI0012BA9BD9|nr:hypothetical protein [Haloarcula sp. K1]
MSGSKHEQTTEDGMRFPSPSRRQAGIAPATAGTMDRREARDSAERSAPLASRAVATH